MIRVKMLPFKIDFVYNFVSDNFFPLFAGQISAKWLSILFVAHFHLLHIFSLFIRSRICSLASSLLLIQFDLNLFSFITLISGNSFFSFFFFFLSNHRRIRKHSIIACNLVSHVSHTFNFISFYFFATTSYLLTSLGVLNLSLLILIRTKIVTFTTRKRIEFLFFSGEEQRFCIRVFCLETAIKVLIINDEWREKNDNYLIWSIWKMVLHRTMDEHRRIRQDLTMCLMMRMCDLFQDINGNVWRKWFISLPANFTHIHCEFFSTVAIYGVMKFQLQIFTANETSVQKHGSIWQVNFES